MNLIEPVAVSLAAIERTIAARPLSLSLKRIMRILYASQRPLRTREIAWACSPRDYPPDAAGRRTLYSLCGARLNVLYRLGVVSRQIDGEVHPWQITDPGRTLAADMPVWNLPAIPEIEDVEHALVTVQPEAA